MPICKDCGIDKPLTVEYWKPNKSRSSGWELSRCRDCFNAYYRDYYKKYPEKRREKERKYAERNPEKYAAKQKRHHDRQREQGKNKYCNRNLERVREYERQRAKTPKRIAYERKRWERRREAYNERMRQLYAINPLPRRLSVQRRRVRKLSAPGSHTAEQFLEKLKYYGYRCVYCGCSLTIQTATEDHRIPLNRGGSDFIANIVPACRSCNSRKGTKTEKEYREWLKGRWCHAKYSDFIHAPTETEEVS